MKKFLTPFFIFMAVALGASGGTKAYASTDLCGGTGGNGQVVSVENNQFILKRNSDGRSQVVHVSNGASIETSAGPKSLSDLQPGNRVTLVGGPNPDGSFTADTVVVCAATTSATGTTHAAPIDTAAYEKVSRILNAATVIVLVSIWLGLVAYLRLKKKKSWVYLLFFTIFYIYAYKVVDYTLIQFQSLLVLQQFVPGLMLSGIAAGKNVNLIPLITLTVEDIKTTLLNILLFMPFGFGLPFVSNLRFKQVVGVGMLCSIGIEFLQFITGFVAHSTFRVADVNDVIFNTIGVAVGYIAFVAFIRIYRRTIRSWRIRTNPILLYITERPQVGTPR